MCDLFDSCKGCFYYNDHVNSIASEAPNPCKYCARHFYDRYQRDRTLNETIVVTVPKIPITEDVKLLCDICHKVGYMSAVGENTVLDDYADEIVDYITNLFNAKCGLYWEKKGGTE